MVVSVMNTIISSEVFHHNCCVCGKTSVRVVNMVAEAEVDTIYSSLLVEASISICEDCINKMVEMFKKGK